MGITDVIGMAGTIWTFFMEKMPTLVTAVPLILIPTALLIIRTVIKSTKSLLFYSKGRRSGR